MSMPTVTVLIDTYNHELFIEDAIRSVLQQDFPSSETEILVVDDGSTDKTPEIIRQYEPRVRLLRRVNGGQAAAFNTGIAEARGEIVAFLDGDDWWAPGKLTAIMGAFAANAGVGLVGHGITIVCRDGRQITEVPREASRFRITSPQDAMAFRMQRGFWGTSRMAYRREILSRIGPVPESVRFEADEYLFTLAGFFADVMTLRDALTFYRLHGGNLFQLSVQDEQAIRRKQQVLAALELSLKEKLKEIGAPPKVARTVLECVEIEANTLHLLLDPGFPWETVLTELKIMRVFHSDASLWQHIFSYARLFPAVILPSNTYYRWRHRLSALKLYQEFRRKLLPFPKPNEVERREKLAP